MWKCEERRVYEKSGELGKEGSVGVEVKVGGRSYGGEEEMGVVRGAARKRARGGRMRWMG